tara:strand:- start:8190 stop:9308 length:1119 start_codon:yes stop_codon:yes gene_type:complete
MSEVFVGAFNPVALDMLESSSGAGAKVQYEIIRAISAKTTTLTSLVMQEVRTWPFSKFYVKGKCIDGINFLPLVNLFFLKKIFFAIYVLIYLFVYKPKTVYFYNTSSSMNVCMFLLGFLSRKQVKVLIIQDLHSLKKLNLENCYRIDKVIEYYCCKLTRYSFDYCIPITKQLGAHLNFPDSRCFPFLGGMTGEIPNEPSVRNFAVFAGALEKYNGLDFLLDAWTRLDVKMELHIFGSGRLNAVAMSYADNNENIIYHGFKSPLIVNKYIRTASVNFCFRYSRGIDEEFFFPSKFFDVIINRGLVVCNRFKNLPEDFEKYIYFVDDNFTELSSIVQRSQKLPSFCDERVELAIQNYSWPVMLESLDQFLGIRL